MTNHLGSVRVSRRLSCCALLVIALAYACGGSESPTDPGGVRGIRVVAGGEQTDTAYSILSQALVVEVRDSRSRLAPGRTVQFRELFGTPSNIPAALQVSPIDGDVWSNLATDVTDAQGRAKTRLRFLGRAGTALLEVSVPDLGAVDTVSYTVNVGRPTRLDLVPRDTTLAFAGTYAVRVWQADQGDNWTPCANPTYSATGVSISSTGQVSATGAIARAPIRVTCSGLTDSTYVSVLPQARMVFNRNGILDLINVDGTGRTTLVTTTNSSMAPSSVAATPSVVFHQGDPSIDAKIWVVEPNGTPRTLSSGTTGPEAWPRLSPDGVWVYFVRDMTTLWRAHLDGSALDSITSFVPPGQYRAPTVSPDGSSVAIEDGNGLKIVDVATKATRSLAVTCHAPRYSPDGAFFACVSSYDVFTVRSDGTGQRLVQRFAELIPDPMSGLDWTADGKWILAQVRGPTLIDVSSGSIIPLPGIGAGFEASLVR